VRAERERDGFFPARGHFGGPTCRARRLSVDR
jgi:hypothetical protein